MPLNKQKKCTHVPVESPVIEQLEDSVMRLRSDIKLFAYHWFKINLEDLQLRVYGTHYYDGTIVPEHDKGYGSMSIIFVDVREFESFDRAVVTALKKFLYSTEEWEDSYANETSVEEWETLLREHWMHDYFPEPSSFKYIPGDILDLNEHFQTLNERSKKIIYEAHHELLEYISKCSIAHLGCLTAFEYRFLAYNPTEEILCHYDWWLDIY